MRKRLLSDRLFLSVTRIVAINSGSSSWSKESRDKEAGRGISQGGISQGGKRQGGSRDKTGRLMIIRGCLGSGSGWVRLDHPPKVMTLSGLFLRRSCSSLKRRLKERNQGRNEGRKDGSKEGRKEGLG